MLMQASDLFFKMENINLPTVYLFPWVVLFLVWGFFLFALSN